MKAKTLALSNLTDVAYQSALSSEKSLSIAQWVVEHRPDFLEKIESEDMDMLVKGFALRWQELNTPEKYDSSTWMKSDKGDVVLSLAYCMSYSQQAFGQLKSENSIQHSVIGAIRNRFNKYKSNCLSDLKRNVRKAILAMSGETKTRDQAKPWSTWMDDIFSNVKARCKTARARNDETAPDEVKLRMAIDAFYAKLK